jgi:hypothetical protein
MRTLLGIFWPMSGEYLLPYQLKSGFRYWSYPWSHPPFTLSFTPYPLFQWYLQSKESILNLCMKCWNSASNAQGSRVTIVVIQVGAVKIYVRAVDALGKRKHRMKLSLWPKLVEKLVWVPVISLCKIFIPSYAFDALLCQNWPFLPPNYVTLLRRTRGEYHENTCTLFK